MLDLGSEAAWALMLSIYEKHEYLQYLAHGLSRHSNWVGCSRPPRRDWLVCSSAVRVGNIVPGTLVLTMRGCCQFSSAPGDSCNPKHDRPSHALAYIAAGIQCLQPIKAGHMPQALLCHPMGTLPTGDCL